jgi:hypothetical protein
MSSVAPGRCPYCASPLSGQTTSSRGFTKASYACGTAVGYYHRQVVPVRSQACRKNEKTAQPQQAR